MSLINQKLIIQLNSLIAADRNDIRILREGIEFDQSVGLDTSSEQREVARLEARIAKSQARIAELENEMADERAALGQTAEAQAQNQTTTVSPGQGSTVATGSVNQPQPLTATESKNLNNIKQNTTTVNVEQAQNSALPTSTGIKSEQQSSTQQLSDQRLREQAQQVQGVGVTGNNQESIRTEILGGAPDNILHSYTSYTYRITLFLLTKDDFNNLASSPTTFVPKFALISSGGGYATSASAGVASAGPVRHPDFLEDFFIDELSMTTVVGLNAKTKAANSVEIGFNIVEPYGMSLLDRLLSVCEVEDGVLNYMDLVS